MNEMIRLLLERHSIREFTGESVKEEDLDLMLRAGMAAPSAVNVQPWAFIVVTEKERLMRLCTELPYAKMLDRAGAAIIVCGIPDKDKLFAPRYWTADCSAATENILLAAHSLHYGAVWTAVYPDEQKIKSVRTECNLPGNIIPFNVIPIGIPKRTDSKPINKFRNENIHRNTW